MKLAYALLNKIGSHKEGTSIMTGDRVRRHKIILELISVKDVCVTVPVQFVH